LVDLKAVRHRCETAVEDLDLFPPLNVDALAEQISARRGRPLHLFRKSTSLGPCGMWLSMPTADYVFFEANTSGWHRDHIILHELGHLVNDHQASDVIDEDTIRELLPHLNSAMVQRVLGRMSYSAVEEQEAEVFASVVRERVGVSAPVLPAAADPGISGVLGRLHSTLGGLGRRRG
jgi:hypothetical protein